MDKLPKTLTNKVIPTLDSRFADATNFLHAKVYLEEVKDEVLPPLPPKCFMGAWYRKVVSSKDNWIGIEGTIKLGEFIPDENRFGSDGRISAKRFLDNPSIYMGGFADSESDAGLGLNVSYTSNDFSNELDHSSPKIAYRPFWRYIYSDIVEDKFNVTRKTVNSWNVCDEKKLENYYFPGDTIKMLVVSPIKDYLQLIIKVVEPTTIEKYVKIREKYQLKDNLPQDFYSPLFYSKGHGNKIAEFKRVNSIDQFGNEGLVVKKTNSVVTEAEWKEVYLFRKINNKIVKIPFIKKRQSEMSCPYSNAFTITATPENLDKGGELISIHPQNVDI